MRAIVNTRRPCALPRASSFRPMMSQPHHAPRVHVPTSSPSAVVRSAPITILPRISYQNYSLEVTLTYDEIKARVIDVVSSFEKVDPSKVNIDANFSKDLGIDSLDAVELVIALEDEFVIEIPDSEAEKIQSVADAVKYIATDPNAK